MLGWVIRTLDLETTAGQTLCLVKDGNGRWTDQRGAHLPRFDGCIDIDLGGSPFTNTLPIRRLDLDVHDGPVELKMLYVPSTPSRLPLMNNAIDYWSVAASIATRQLTSVSAPIFRSIQRGW
jgi:hypothetical protein